ncbi:hypothetical protein D3C85_1362580 [compost metagenome]
MFLAGSLDGFDKVLVVPGVDLPWARNVRSIREQSLQLRHQWAVRARFKAGRQNGRQFEVLGQIGQRQHVVLELVRIDVAYQRQQTGLMVDQQYGRLIFIETFVGSGHFHSPGEQRKPRWPPLVREQSPHVGFSYLRWESNTSWLLTTV